MTIPLQIAFRNVDTSEALRATIQNHAGKLEHFSDKILSCRVVVQRIDKRNGAGSGYRIRIHLEIPRENPMVVIAPAIEKRNHEDAYMAVREAFNAMRRRLGDFARINRGGIRRNALLPLL